MTRSKRYNENLSHVREGEVLDPATGIKRIRAFKKTKFDETLDVAVRLGIDFKQADQHIRGSFSLPHGTGKSKKVIVFTRGDKAEDARKNGADEVGAEELVKKVEGGWMDFDVAIASPDMMGQVGKLGRVLGPQGKMPSPKSGTVTDHIGNAVKEFKAGKIEFRSDAGGNVHAPIGKLSFSDVQLKENIDAFIDHVRVLKPASSKGNFIRSVTLSATMSPGVRLAVQEQEE